jgi:hypothetical protein
MSFQLDNRVWADEFHAYASNDSDLDDFDDYEITELPIIPPVPSLELQDFLRARHRYHTPDTSRLSYPKLRNIDLFYATFYLSSTCLSRTSSDTQRESPNQDSPRCGLHPHLF